MADRDRNPDTSIAGREADAANDAQDRKAPPSTTADDADDDCEGLDIIFELETPETSH